MSVFNGVSERINKKIRKRNGGDYIFVQEGMLLDNLNSINAEKKNCRGSSEGDPGFGLTLLGLRVRKVFEKNLKGAVESILAIARFRDRGECSDFQLVEDE